MTDCNHTISVCLGCGEFQILEDGKFREPTKEERENIMAAVMYNVQQTPQ